MRWSVCFISVLLLMWPTRGCAQFVIQNAGNMGVLSAGAGLDYGRHRQWETYLLMGYIPKHQSSRGKLTMTLKQNYIPWSINMSRLLPAATSQQAEHWSIEPLTASIYLNTIFGNEFWMTEPDRYPDGYYGSINSRLRLNIALGQRVTWHIPRKSGKRSRSISLFYEVSTCDLYLSAKFEDGSIPLKDIIGLSVGLKLDLSHE